MRAVIVEDELSGMKNLQNLLAKYCENIEIVATAEDVEGAVKMFNTPTVMPDVAFLESRATILVAETGRRLLCDKCSSCVLFRSLHVQALASVLVHSPIHSFLFSSQSKKRGWGRSGVEQVRTQVGQWREIVPASRASPCRDPYQCRMLGESAG